MSDDLITKSLRALEPTDIPMLVDHIRRLGGLVGIVPDCRGLKLVWMGHENVLCFSDDPSPIGENWNKIPWWCNSPVLREREGYRYEFVEYDLDDEYVNDELSFYTLFVDSMEILRYEGLSLRLKCSWEDFLEYLNKSGGKLLAEVKV